MNKRQTKRFEFSGTSSFPRELFHTALTCALHAQSTRTYLVLSLDDLIGAASIGLYQVERTVGSGSFGNVQLCVHKLTGEKVAVKTLKAKQYAVCPSPFDGRCGL